MSSCLSKWAKKEKYWACVFCCCWNIWNCSNWYHNCSSSGRVTEICAPLTGFCSEGTLLCMS